MDRGETADPSRHTATPAQGPLGGDLNFLLEDAKIHETWPQVDQGLDQVHTAA